MLEETLNPIRPKSQHGGQTRAQLRTFIKPVRVAFVLKFPDHARLDWSTWRTERCELLKERRQQREQRGLNLAQHSPDSRNQSSREERLLKGEA